MQKQQTTQHTPGAIRAAEAITGDNYNAPKGRYETDHGRKTVVGIADLIDRETAAPDLLEALEKAKTWARPYLNTSGHDAAARAITDVIDAAIAKAKGGAS